MYQANNAVKYGEVECALALGFERMKPGSLGTNFPDRAPPTLLLNMRSAEIEQEGLGENHGPGAPRMFDNGAREYFAKYGGGIEHLAKIGMLTLQLCTLHFEHSRTTASKNHKHSVNNPYSQFRDGWSVEQVMKAPMITNTLTKFMCSPTSVGTCQIFNRTKGLTFTNRMELHVVLLHPRTSFMLIDSKTKPLK